MVLDPDPHGTALIWVAESGPTKIEKAEKFQEISSFEVLDVLFWRLKAFSVAWASFMEV